MIRLRLVAAFAAALVASGCGTSDDTERSAPTLDRALRVLTSDGLSGAVGLVRTNNGTWRGASGYAVRRKAEPQDRFGIASTTKAFVATVVLQLVGEGRLSLEDRVEKWLPGVVRSGPRITVRQLLNHTSGLPQGFPFARAVGGRLLSRPGAEVNYSNANYVLLGLIIEKVTSRSLAEVLRDRIFRPLDLDDTSYGDAGTSRGSDRPWLGSPEESIGAFPAAGGIVSTTDDVAQFFRALLGGELLPPDLLAEMTRTVDSGEYGVGLGLFRSRVPCGVAWGNGGIGAAYATVALAARDGSRVVVVAENEPAFAAVEAVAARMYCS